ncbi:MAG: hypothetical protein ACK5LC_06175 [Coprobacillaceae bacterium]
MNKLKKTSSIWIISTLIIIIVIAVLNYNRDIFPRVFTEWSLDQKEIEVNIINTTEGVKEIIDFYQNHSDYMYVKLNDEVIYKYDFETLELTETDYEYMYQLEITPYDFNFGDIQINEERIFGSIAGRKITFNDPIDQKIQILKDENIIYEIEINESISNEIQYQFNENMNFMAITEGTDSIILDLESKEIVYSSNVPFELNVDGKYLTDSNNNVYEWEDGVYKKMETFNQSEINRYNFFDDYILEWQRQISSTNRDYTADVKIYENNQIVMENEDTFIGIIDNNYYSIKDTIYNSGYIIERYNLKDKKSEQFNLVCLEEEKKYIYDYLETIVRAQMSSISPKMAYDKVNDRLFLYCYGTDNTDIITFNFK